MKKVKDDIPKLSDIVLENMIDDKGHIKSEIWDQFRNMTYAYYMIKKHEDNIYNNLNDFDIGALYVANVNEDKEGMLKQRRNLDRAIAELNSLKNCLINLEFKINP